MKSRPFLIGIAGPSCSGKTSLATGIADKLGPKKISVVSLDQYYLDKSNESPEKIATYNFDHPEALDVALLKKQLRAIACGKSVTLPNYDFSSHSRTNQTQQFSPTPIVLIEGLHTLYWHEIRGLLHLRVYMDCNDSMSLYRRLRRDTCSRNRTADSIIRQFYQTVRPSIQKFIRPYRKFANIHLDGTLPKTVQLADFVSKMRAYVKSLAINRTNRELRVDYKSFL